LFSAPQAIKIHLVLDNMNTHDTSAFYENSPADEALALAHRFEMNYPAASYGVIHSTNLIFTAL